MNSHFLIVGELSALPPECFRGSAGVVRVPNLAAAAVALAKRTPDMILTEFHLHDGSCLGSLPAWTSTSAVVVVASCATLAERVQALEAGVEDFVALPVDEREIALRIERALGRWRRRRRDHLIRFSDFALDPGARVLRRDGRGEVALSDSERSLLELLLARPGHSASRLEITRRCLRTAFHESSRAPDMLASKLRAKLRQLGETNALETLRGEGYRLRLEHRAYA